MRLAVNIQPKNFHPLILLLICGSFHDAHGQELQFFNGQVFMKNFLVLVPLVLVAVALNQTKDRDSAMPTLTEINDLASPDHLRTEADAANYVAALWSHFELGSLHDKELKEGIAHAELLAVRDPNSGISNGRIAKVFNDLMMELSAPESMRITEPEVLVFRKRIARFTRGSFVFPNLFARTLDGRLEERSRPVEALFLIYLLQYGPNIEAAKKTVESGASDGQGQRSDPVFRPTITTPSQRETEYAAAVERYFQTHSETELVQNANRFLNQLLQP